MIFQERYQHCERCDLEGICKYKEIYYKNKGEWPVKELATTHNGKTVCKHAVRQGLVK